MCSGIVTTVYVYSCVCDTSSDCCRGEWWCSYCVTVIVFEMAVYSKDVYACMIASRCGTTVVDILLSVSIVSYREIC